MNLRQRQYISHVADYLSQRSSIASTIALGAFIFLTSATPFPALNLSISHISSQARPTPYEVMQSLLRAVEGSEAVEYEVRREHTTVDGKKYNARTRVLATRTPFRFRARLEGEGIPITQLAIADGKVTRASDDGKASMAPFIISSRGGQVILNDANDDVAATWRLLLDVDHINQAIESRNILLVGEDEIEGEPCHIVLYTRPLTAEVGSTTEFYWISAKSGLPRAVQRWSLQRGRTRLGTQYIISNIKTNPSFPPEAFSYVPTESDSSKVRKSAWVRKSASQTPVANRSRLGTQLPDMEVMNMQYEPLKLSDFKGRATLINFWAPWCGPCMGELPVLERIRNVRRKVADRGHCRAGFSNQRHGVY